MRLSWLLCLCAFVIALSLLLGGGTQSGFLSDAVLQASAIPLLLVALWRMADVKSAKQPRLEWALCLAVVLAPLVQLVPLPPEIWTALPNTEPQLQAFDLLHRELPWRPLSISPRATWLCFLALIPPISIFLSTVLLTHHERRSLSLVILAIGIVSVFAGLVQVAQGPSSPLRFFEITNPSEAVGFFANRNHFAALLYALLLFAAAWTANAASFASSDSDPNKFKTASIVALVACFTVLVVLVAGQAMARSRAGLGLTILALFGAFALAFSGRRGASGNTPAKLLVGATALAMLFAAQFALYRLMDRFTLDPLEDARIPFARNTIEAAQAYMPFGSGLGSFVPVYAMREHPHDAFVGVYANHAHNDVLELWLESGFMGLVLMGLFGIWWSLRSIEVWRGPRGGASRVDRSLARAATLVVALLIAHSFVDYHLRTGAIMAIMAFSCALLVTPLADDESSAELGLKSVKERARPRGPGKVTSPVSPLAQPRSSPTPGQAAHRPASAPRPPGERWGAEIEWPEEWRTDPKKSSSSTAPQAPGYGKLRRE